MTQKLSAIALVATLSLLAINVTAQVSITSGGGLTYSQNSDQRRWSDLQPEL